MAGAAPQTSGLEQPHWLLGSDLKPTLLGQTVPEDQAQMLDQETGPGCKEQQRVKGRLSIYLPIRLRGNNYMRCY